jgi:hypothetical protein
MAITTVRTTYALDVPTVRALDDLAKHWHVSKSETLRRLILSAAKEQLTSRQGNPRLEAFRALQDRYKTVQAEQSHPPTRLPVGTQPIEVERTSPLAKFDTSSEQLDSWLL